MKQFLALIMILISLSGWSANLQVTSSPEGADIFIRTRSDETPAKIGTTPFSMSINEVKQKFGLGPSFFVEVKKEGYEPYNIMLAMVNTQADIQINTKLPVSRDLVMIKKFDKVATLLFEAQRLTRDKNYDEALKLLDEVEKEESNLSVTKEMKGGVFYLKKDFNSALSHYRKAFALNAENKDAYSMKEYLEKTLGLKKDE